MRIVFLAFLFSISFFLFSCEKNDDALNNIDESCILSSVRHDIIKGNFFRMDYYYDEENRVSRIEYLGNDIDSFEYLESKVVFYEGLGDISTAVLDSSGYPKTLTKNANYEPRKIQYYKYNSNNFLIELKIVWEYFNPEEKIYEYKYLDDNLTSIYEGDVLKRSYEYYPDLVNEYNFNLEDYKYVLKTKVSKNLPKVIIDWQDNSLNWDISKNMSNSSWNILKNTNTYSWYEKKEYSYELDDKNRIIKIFGRVELFTGKVTEYVRTFTYSCE